MLNKFKFFILITLIFFNKINCQDIEDSYTFKSKGLLIFLDDSETGRLGPISTDAMSAIAQKAGPIIISASVIYNIISNKNCLKDPALERFNKYKKIKSQVSQNKSLNSDFNKPESEKEKLCIASSGINFNDKDWIIKKITASILLLIPNDYLNQEKINTNSVRQYLPNNQLTDVEYKMGLKVNHLKTITINDIDIKHFKGNPPIYANYFINSVWSGKKSAIFVTRAEYKDLKKEKVLPQWVIYITGHGMIGESIVDVSITNFKKFLEFLDTKINTKLFVYTSCYAAGLNTELIYKDSKSPLQKKYSFAIVTEALTDAPTSGRGFNLDLTNDKSNISYSGKIDFSEFLNKATSSEKIDFIDIIEPIFKDAKITDKTKNLNEIPQIKLPGLEWFSVMNSREEIVSIGNILAKSRNPNNPLDVVKFFKTTPLVILLYAPTIPFELIIPKDITIISMIPDNVMHSIKKITLNNYDILDFFNNQLYSIENLEATKGFWIEEINGIFKELSNTQEPIIIKNVLLYTDEFIYFTWENKFYKFKNSKLTEIKEKEYKKEMKFAKKGVVATQESFVEKTTSKDIKKIQDTLIKKQADLKEK
ncbi:MAG: hypothetical protein P4L22_02295 [Candidatus Babeliales bacterium]|nr:hypothetical protein [Candidatus Babeliales bacterium]